MSPLPHRLPRVEHEIQKEIGQMLLQELKDPRLGFITITRIEVTRDLHLARVYYSVMGNPAQQEASRKALLAAAGFIRKRLGERIRLRYTPEVQFYRDDSIEKNLRITKLLDGLKRESKTE